MELEDKMSSKGKYCAEMREKAYAWRLKNPERWAEIKRRTYLKNKGRYCFNAKRNYRNDAERQIALSRIRTLKNEFGITKEQYDQLVNLHDGKCGICNNPFTSTRDRHLDHSHATNKVRGLLCGNCNRALGAVEKADNWLMKAMEYLQKHNEPGFNVWRWK